MYQFRLKLVFLLVAVIGYGCGESKLNKRGRFSDLAASSDATADGPIVKEILSDEEKEALAKACPGSSAGLRGLMLADDKYSYIDGNETSLKNGKSLCDLLIATGSQAAIYQFVGPACTNCQEEVQTVAAALTASQYASYITHVIIVSAAETDASAEGLITTLTADAPRATFAQDDGSKTLDSFAKTAGSFDAPTLVTMAKSGKGLTINNDTSTYSDIVEAAEGLVQAQDTDSDGEQNVAPEPSIFDTPSKAGWDGLANIGTAGFQIVTIK